MSETSGPEAEKRSTELVEHIDSEGRVLEVVTRREMREGLLRHRCTYVAVVTSDHELVVHQRADWKDVYPGWWDLMFGGVCDPGEPWDEAAARELAEEAGLVAALTPVGEASYEGPDGSVLGRMYVAFSDDEPTCPDGEVVAIDRVPVSAIEPWMADHQVCLDSAAAWPTMAEFLNNL